MPGIEDDEYNFQPVVTIFKVRFFFVNIKGTSILFLRRIVL